MSSVGNPPAERYSDFNAIIVAIQRMTIPPIKACIKNISDSNLISGHMSLQGLKKDLIDRLVRHFSHLKVMNLADQYRESKRIVEEQYRAPISAASISSESSFQYTPNAPSRPSSSSLSSFGPAHLPPVTKYPGTPPAYGNSGLSSSSSMSAGAQAYQPTRRPHFRASPFLVIKEWVGPMVLCPEAYNTQAKSSALFDLNLTPAHLELLRRPTAIHQLRLFCTTKTMHDAAMSPSHPAPVEFPIFCEVRVNNVNLSVNLKGKKTAAKVLAPNINKDNALYFGGQRNRLELMYWNTAQKHVMSVAICEVRNADSLARKVRRDKFRTKKDVLGAMRRAADDDDIEMGDTPMGLKCPLSYMRLSNPIRSTVCNHMQCFDALSFFSVNEQTPSWQCPYCFKTLNPDSLFLDGYVQDILDKVPEEEETVLIDSDGRWHTPNDKFTSNNVEAGGKVATPMGDVGKSATPLLAHPPSSVTEAEGSVKSEDTVAWTPSAASGQDHAKAGVEVFEIDDDEEPPRPAFQRQRSLAQNGTGSNSDVAPHGRRRDSDSGTASLPPVAQAQPSGAAGREAPPTDVIDLTLSDSDDEDHRPDQRRPYAGPSRSSTHEAQGRLAHPSVARNGINGGQGQARGTVSGGGDKGLNSDGRSGRPGASGVGGCDMVPMDSPVHRSSSTGASEALQPPLRRSNSSSEGRNGKGDNEDDDGGPVLERHHKRRRPNLGTYAEEAEEDSYSRETSEGLQENERAGLAVGL